MARKWTNSKGRGDDGGVRNACGCRLERPHHRCMGEEGEAETPPRALAPWIHRELAGLEDEDRRRMLRSLGSAEQLLRTGAR